MNLTAIGGRRFVLTVFFGIVTTYLRFTNKLNDESYANVIIWTVGAYIAGGTFEAVKPLTQQRQIRAADIKGDA